MNYKTQDYEIRLDGASLLLLQDNLKSYLAQRIQGIDNDSSKLKTELLSKSTHISKLIEHELKRGKKRR